MTANPVSEGAVSEGAVSEGAVSEGAVSEGAVSEGAVSEGAVSESAVSESAVSESAVSESRPGVPWATVVTLAAVLAYADGFWMTSMRGAVGAIERSHGPFASWLRESALVIPVFAAAVLAALTLAQRLFGPTLRGWSKVAATALLVAAAGALAGVAETAVSSAYDYHLQFAQLKMMDAMRTSCVTNCLAQQRQATLHLQVRTVGYTGVLILLTNVVLVAWIVAMRGGRLNVSASRRAGSDPVPPVPPVAGSRDKDLRMLVAVGLLGGAVVHTAMVPAQLAEWRAAAVCLMLLSAAEILIALKLVMDPNRGVLLAALAVCVGPLALWLYSRSIGLPFGPGAGRAAAVGLSDSMACALQAGTLLTAVVLLCGHRRLRQRPPASAHVRALALAAVAAAAIVGLAGTHLAWFGDFAGAPAHHSAIIAPAVR